MYMYITIGQGSCDRGTVAGYGPPAGSCPSVALTLSGLGTLICMLCTCTQPGSSFIFVHGVTTGPLDHWAKMFSIYTKFWF